MQGTARSVTMRSARAASPVATRQLFISLTLFMRRDSSPRTRSSKWGDKSLCFAGVPAAIVGLQRLECQPCRRETIAVRSVVLKQRRVFLLETGLRAIRRDLVFECSRLEGTHER